MGGIENRENPENSEQEKRLLDRLVENAVKRWKEKEIKVVETPYGPEECVYSTYGATYEALETLKTSPRDTFNALLEQTSVTPSQLELEPVDTWEELFYYLNQQIIRQEIFTRFPEIEEGDDQRFAHYLEKHPPVALSRQAPDFSLLEQQRKDDENESSDKT